MILKLGKVTTTKNTRLSLFMNNDAILYKTEKSNLMDINKYST